MRPTLIVLLLSLAATRLPAGGERRWVETRSAHFVVASDADPHRVESTAREFEELRSLFGALWPDARLDPGRPLLVLLARDEESLAELMPELWEEPRARPVGLFVRSADRFTIALRGDASARPVGHMDFNPFFHVNHEYVHLLTDLNYPDLPLWLHEGLAEYYGNVLVKKDHVLQGLALPHHVLELRRRRPLLLEDLFRVERSSAEYSHEHRATTFYAQSWALVHMALTRPGGQRARELNEYMELSRSRPDPVESARATFGDLRRLQAELRAHYSKSLFPPQRVEAAHPGTRVVIETRTLREGEVLSRRGAFHIARGQTQRGRTDLARALELEPELPEATAQLGLLAWREGDEAEALRWLDRSLAAGSRNPMAYVAHATLSAASGASDEALAGAEANLARSLELAPSLAPAYALLANVRKARGAPASVCVEPARRAVELDPRESRFRTSLARLLLAAGRLAEAEHQLEAALGEAGRGEDAWLEAIGLSARLRYDPTARLRRGCLEGDGESCRALGERYETGRGVETNLKKAVGYYALGCELGELASCFEAGLAHLSGEGVARDAEKAVRLLERACEGGDAPACDVLAELRVRP